MSEWRARRIIWRFEPLRQYVDNVADAVCGERNVARFRFVIDVVGVAGKEINHGAHGTRRTQDVTDNVVGPVHLALVRREGFIVEGVRLQHVRVLVEERIGLVSGCVIASDNWRSRHVLGV